MTFCNILRIFWTLCAIFWWYSRGILTTWYCSSIGASLLFMWCGLLYSLLIFFWGFGVFLNLLCYYETSCANCMYFCNRFFCICAKYWSGVVQVSTSIPIGSSISRNPSARSLGNRAESCMGELMRVVLQLSALLNISISQYPKEGKMYQDLYI